MYCYICFLFCLQYAVIVGILFVIQLTAGILGAVFKDKVSSTY